ncbi:hypothetical protein [Sphingomonas sp. Leaf4]|uniref:hypothetical protein n=1 Tax=Sphingomonas sp. Leaf4 TaxID=2876553 RepID=UPI001E573F7D|nr:hypothetical protein [Sphingomonas sp. Leaf4]
MIRSVAQCGLHQDDTRETVRPGTPTGSVQRTTSTSSPFATQNDGTATFSLVA